MELQQKALQAIRTRRLQSIYLVIGSGNVFTRASFARPFWSVFPLGKDDLKFASFDMEKDPLDMVIQEAQSLPFFGDQRYFLSSGPHFS